MAAPWLCKRRLEHLRIQPRITRRRKLYRVKRACRGELTRGPPAQPYHFVELVLAHAVHWAAWFARRQPTRAASHQIQAQA